jgi:hypothetical protein
MVNKSFVNGLTVLGVGLLASSISSLLEHFAVLGRASDLARGFFDGLAVGAFCVAVFVLVRSRRTN